MNRYVLLFLEAAGSVALLSTTLASADPDLPPNGNGNRFEAYQERHTDFYAETDSDCVGRGSLPSRSQALGSDIYAKKSPGLPQSGSSIFLATPTPPAGDQEF